MNKSDSIFSAFTTCLEMMEDRDYYISQDLKNITKEEFEKKFQKNGNGLVMIFSKNSTKNEKLILTFKTDEKQLKKEDITIFAKKLYEGNYKRGIIIGIENLSIHTKRLIKELNLKTDFNIEYFKVFDLEFNITKNEIVPKHFLVCENEKKVILKKYKIKENKLPKILSTDPMACYFGLVKGDMIKILRPSPNVGFYAFYRICISSN